MDLDEEEEKEERKQALKTTRNLIRLPIPSLSHVCHTHFPTQPPPRGRCIYRSMGCSFPTYSEWFRCVRRTPETPAPSPKKGIGYG